MPKSNHSKDLYSSLGTSPVQAVNQEGNIPTKLAQPGLDPCTTNPDLTPIVVMSFGVQILSTAATTMATIGDRTSSETTTRSPTTTILSDVDCLRRKELTEDKRESGHKHDSWQRNTREEEGHDLVEQGAVKDVTPCAILVSTLHPQFVPAIHPSRAHVSIMQDWADIDLGISEGVDYIAVSFVNDADDIKPLKNYLSSRSSDFIGVLAKIESLEALQNLKDIVEASDGIMVARGDLGVQIPLEQIPAVQEEITRLCRQLNKPVIVASQLLESMVEYPTPTRAEVADVSEAVRQYADALMLSGESAVGSFGDKALSVLRIASGRMELWSRQENRQRLLPQLQLGVSLSDRISEQICNCSVEMANKLGVDAIFVYTRHGHMASLLSRNRPNPPIFAFTNNKSTRKALNLQWGVIPLHVDLSDDMEENMKKSFELIKSRGLVKEGDVVLVVSDVNPSSANPSAFQSIKVNTIV
ncbi:hypothetical protein GIB67_015256 [Kingdonia uniflora]|uniref:Pyruvate kinase n=1 Tax=Kingdonia uniflora TaxID=39325 RepID=A0A7J7MT40_9MAGN|nr:hypothetical protein GIB67_015256 [Kingdonia uniflora]